jgi:aminoglycoside 6'-N-acetyltransferase
MDIRFDPVRAADLPMLAEWLSRPHWRAWWGDPDEELGFIRDMVEGREGLTSPFIFFVDRVPLGYIQHWPIGLHQTPEWAEDNPWLMELPAEAVGVDLSIANPDRLGQGIGTAVLRAFVARLRQEGHETIIIDPDPENARAVAAYRKAGFSPVPHLEGRTDGVLIMQHQPDIPAP